MAHGPAVRYQRVACRAGFGIDKVAYRALDHKAKRRVSSERGWNLRADTARCMADHCEKLVIRPVQIELYLTVLVNRAQRIGRQRPASALAEAFGPELAEPPALFRTPPFWKPGMFAV